VLLLLLCHLYVVNFTSHDMMFFYSWLILFNYEYLTMDGLIGKIPMVIQIFDGGGSLRTIPLISKNGTTCIRSELEHCMHMSLCGRCVLDYVNI
jgi:hypothetical protein